MRRTAIRGALSILFTFCMVSLSGAEGEQDKSTESLAVNEITKTLEVNKLTKTLEVRQSQIGFRDTLIFYTFAEQKAVLKLRIDNRDKTFPMTATVFLFAETVTEEGLEKWLNNQHSDGLFPEVPNPTKTIELPKRVGKVTSHEFVDQSKQQFGEYDNYTVEFSVKDHVDKAGVTLKGFTGSTKVHVKTK